MARGQAKPPNTKPHEKDFSGAMIAWLRGKPQDVWLEMAGILNWDNAGRVFEWMVSQPECDRAVAARLLWLSSLAKLPDSAAALPGEGRRIGAQILGNWDNGFYRDSKLALSLEDVSGIVSDYRQRSSSAVKIPSEFLGPFHGRKPRLRRRDDPTSNPQVWDLCANLGSEVGRRPDLSRPLKAGFAWVKGDWNRSVAANYPLRFASDREAARFLWGDDAAVRTVRQRRRSEAWSRIRSELRKALTWVAITGILAVMGATLLRRLHFGVWF